MKVNELNNLKRCSICDYESTNKNHFHKDPKYPKTNYVCNECHIEIYTVVSEYYLYDDENKAVFNYEF